MRMVVKYAKRDRVKYISHLDLMRTLHRALRRAGIPVAFSQGYNPQPKVAFGPPLPVGMTSEGEYMDIVLDLEMNPKEFCHRMNSVLPQGITVLDAVAIDKSFPSLMSVIERALYHISIKTPVQSIEEALKDFLSQPVINITKSGKKGERTVNIRPMIHRLETVSQGKEVVVMEAVLSAGSKESLNAEQMVCCFLEFIGMEDDSHCFANIHRLEMFLYKDNAWITPLELGRG
ncbi:radical SAM-linked protein [Caldicoprobacter guelmensis]|uniref:TIGR03936 family radical SAM-associated protein n=1 Tax=Caldicoprobacter guelmensis TaxID=1170224 RepID=UPI001959C7E4|nr:TIGR03936 family radical SAM-associated protein [Caldicoprobacter guelmensis]MBM7583073.1 radical SAM-linked protein [Caldicoprobacter guelmensis]